jgi:glyoxylase I family protein
MLKKLDHVGFRCSDPRAVVEFYTKVLGADFVRAVIGSRVSAEDDFPHLNVFLRLADGTMLDFMDSTKFKPALGDPNTPPWVHHVAFNVESERIVLDFKARVEAAGSKVDVMDRPRAFAIYFYDPFGNRLEIMYERQKIGEKDKAEAYAVLEKWEKQKSEGQTS